jgi:hypothetical protein
MLLQRAAFANVVTLDDDTPSVETGDAHDDSPLVKPSCEELVEILQRFGATIVVRQEHGVFLRARRHLIFVRRRSVVDDSEVRDALQAAGIPASRFDELLESSRRLSA